MPNSTAKKTSSIYFQNLDAARFIAAFSVFLLHFSNELKAIFPDLTGSTIFKGIYLFTSKGSLGVNFFFVLSGFLITYLILQERKNKGRFHLGRFLARRTLRIWPLYFIIGLIGFVVFPAILADYHTEHQAINYFFFLANFDEIWYGAQDSINFLTAPWSVSVEEQFYLFWGIALFLLFKTTQALSKKSITFPSMLFLILALYLISFYFQWENRANERVIYHHTLAVCQDILTGAFVAISLFSGKKWVNWLQQLPRFGIVLIYVLGIMTCLGKNKLFGGDAIVLERFCLSLFFGFVILDQIRGKYSLFKLGKIKVFNYLGKISYGIYMYHLVIMYLLLRYLPFEGFGILGGSILFLVLSLAGTILISGLSYRFIESKFLSLKPQ